MRYLSSVVVLVLIICGTGLSQTIYPCKTHTREGEPIDYQLEWNISPRGEYISILFSNDEKPFGEELLYLLIDKKSNDSYIPFDSKVISIDSSSTWAAQNYRLSEPGEFLIYFTDSSQKRLAQQKISVDYRATFSYSSNDITDIYYDNCQMLFCERVIAGQTFKVRNDLYLKNGRATIYIYLNNFKSLRTTRLSVMIWRKEPRDFSFNEFVDSKKYKIDPLWPDTFFKYQFNEPGEYKIAVYNDKDALIKYNFIKVF